MNERRRFLQVLGSTVVALSAGCGEAPEPSNSSGGTDGSGGAGGAGGTDGAGGAGGVGGAGGAGGAGGSAACAPVGTNVGMASDFATDGIHKVAGTTFLIGRDAGGLYAMTSLCTHQQCNLNVKGVLIAGGIHCNCHGAEYDQGGAVTKGPAVNPLKHYQLTLECDGNLWVDKAVVVPVDQRLMV